MTTARRPLAGTLLVVGAGGLASIWPLTSYVLGPLALPFVVGVALVVIAVLREPAVGVATSLALAPLINAAPPAESLGIALPTHPLQVVVPPIAFFTLAYAGLLMPGARWGRESRALAVAFAAFLLAAAISSSQAIDPSQSVNKLVLVATAVALAAAIPLTCRGRRQFLIIVGGAIVGLLIAAVQGLIQHYTGVFSTQGFVAGFEVVGRIQGSFGHPNLYAGYLATLIPLGLAVGTSNRFPASLRVLSIAAVALAAPALYFTYGRGALIGLIGGAVIWLGVMRPRASLAIGLAVIVAAVIAAPATLKDRFNPQTSEGDITLRSDIWGSALDIYAERPITGVGVNNYPIAYEELPATAANASQRRLLHQDQLLIPPHPQSIYLQALAEQGIIGLLALLALIGTGLLVLFRASRSLLPTTRVVGLGVGVGFVGVLIHGFAEVPLMSEALLPIVTLLAVAAMLAESGEVFEPSTREQLSEA